MYFCEYLRVYKKFHTNYKFCLLFKLYIHGKEHPDDIPPFLFQYFVKKLQSEESVISFTKELRINSICTYEERYPISKLLSDPQWLDFLFPNVSGRCYRGDDVWEIMKARGEFWFQICRNNPTQQIFNKCLQLMDRVGEYLNNNCVNAKQKQELVTGFPFILKCFLCFVSDKVPNHAQYANDFIAKKQDLLKKVKRKKAVVDILELCFSNTSV